MKGKMANEWHLFSLAGMDFPSQGGNSRARLGPQMLPLGGKYRALHKMNKEAGRSAVPPLPPT